MRLRQATRPAFRAALLALGAFGALVAAAPAPAAAQDLFAAIVRVDEDIITGFDVKQRVNLLELERGGSVSDDEATRDLVDDLLKRGEAKRLGVTIPPEELAEAIDRLVQGNNTSRAAFERRLNSAGVEMSAFERRIETQLMWRRVLGGRFGERLRPSEDEVDAAMEEAAADAFTVYDIKQVIFPLAADAPGIAVRDLFQRIADARPRVNSCGDVEAVARSLGRHSVSEGSLRLEQAPPALRDVIRNLRNGQMSEPLRSPTSVNLFVRCGTRTIQASRSEVFNRVAEEISDRFSQSYLADLKRTALIEPRI